MSRASHARAVAIGSQVQEDDRLHLNEQQDPHPERRIKQTSIGESVGMP